MGDPINLREERARRAAERLLKLAKQPVVYPQIDLSKSSVFFKGYAGRTKAYESLPDDWKCITVHDEEKHTLLLSLRMTRGQWEEFKKMGDKLLAPVEKA